MLDFQERRPVGTFCQPGTYVGSQQEKGVKRLF
jgi:hypothetical protein